MDRQVLTQLIAQGEGSKVEFKVRLPSQLRLARSVCAFANTQGGVIIAGVDDQGHIVGVDTPSETWLAYQSCLDYLDPRPEITVEQINLDGAVLVTCLVHKGKDKPYQVANDKGGRIYIRAGASIQPVVKGKPLAQEDGMRQRLSLTSLQKDILATIDAQKGIRLDRLCARHNLSRHRVAKLLVPMIRAGVVVERDGGYILR